MSKIRRKDEHDYAIEALKVLDEYCRNHAQDLCESCAFKPSQEEEDEAAYGCGMIAGLMYADKFGAICDRFSKRAGKMRERFQRNFEEGTC